MVYNITPYLEFHPGGEDELMRGAGIDGTKLFDEVRGRSKSSMILKMEIGDHFCQTSPREKHIILNEIFV